MIYVAIDTNGIPRVFGQAKEDKEARLEVVLALQEYVIKHPECSPLVSQWLIIPD